MSHPHFLFLLFSILYLLRSNFLPIISCFPFHLSYPLFSTHFLPLSFIFSLFCLSCLLIQFLFCWQLSLFFNNLYPFTFLLKSLLLLFLFLFLFLFFYFVYFPMISISLIFLSIFHFFFILLPSLFCFIFFSFFSFLLFRFCRFLILYLTNCFISVVSLYLSLLLLLLFLHTSQFISFSFLFSST